MALSLSNVVTLFSIQIGMVAFPNLVLLERGKWGLVYKNIEKVFILGSFLLFLLYIPLTFVLRVWLPQYSESIQWLILLIPFTVYESKNQMLFNTYMKMLRKEKALFQINLIVFLVCCVFDGIVVFGLKNVAGVLVILNIVLIIKSLYIERIVSIELGLRKRLMSYVEGLLVFCLAIGLYVYM